MESKLTKNQKKHSEWKIFQQDNQELRIRSLLRYDDECGNGHNTFSITGTIHEKRRGHWEEYSGGCIHEEIEKHFPEYAHLIKWHLVSSDGPLHYLENTLFLAGDRDCWGKRKGEIRGYSKVLKFKDFPITFRLNENFLTWLESADIQSLETVPIEYVNRPDTDYNFEPKYTYSGFTDQWHKCPFDSLTEAIEMLQALREHVFEIIKIPSSWGEGKKREFDAARRAAIWPEATDTELMASNLKEKLVARLPDLMMHFKADIEALDFTF